MRGGKNQNLSYSSNDVAWSHLDNNLLASAATNGVVCIWDLTLFGRQKQKMVYQEHERTAHTVTFHNSDPNLLISGSQDGTIKCFDMRVEKAVHSYMSNSESIRDVKFSPHNTNVFAAVSENGSVQIWDLKRQDRFLNGFTAHSGPIYTCDWHPTTPNWLATGSRDKQIKIWNTGSKPCLEYTIHTIAVVGRVKWRPEKKYHIASCALVVDYNVYIWDIRRPFIPYASFNEHTNVTTDIAFKFNDPNVLLSTSKDSTIYKHNFLDAQYPFAKANPQASTINMDGELLFAQRIYHPELSKLSPINNKPVDSFTWSLSLFHQTKSQMFKILKKKTVVTNEFQLHNEVDLGKEADIFRECGKRYCIRGDLEDVCRYNEAIAKKYGDESTALLWLFLGRLFEIYAQTSNGHNVQKSFVPMSHPKPITAPKTEYFEKKERIEETKSLQTQISRPPGHSDSKLMDTDTIGDSDIFLFGNSEINFDNLDCVKGFRKGFLYIGNWQHEQVKELQAGLNAEQHNDPDTSHSDCFRSNEPPELLKVVSEAHISVWNPFEMIRGFLVQHAEQGDIQTVATLLLALQSKQIEIQIDELVQEYWLMAYIDLMHKNQMWNEAAVIMNTTTSPGVQQMNQQSTTVQLGCGNCNRVLTNNPAYYCTKCKSTESSICSYCRGVVRGLYAVCPTCYHGGHLKHMQEWFESNSKCPVCGHLCEYD